MDKRGDVKKNIIALLMLVTIIVIASYSVYSSLCGGTTCNTGTSIVISNDRPNITSITPPGTITLTVAVTKEINVIFNATDPNGAADINKSTANASVFKAGETTRYNYTCTNISEQGNTIRFNCSIQMYFYDGEGTWTVNVSVQDNSELSVINQTATFSVNALDDVDIDDTTINWAGLTVGSNDNQGDAITFTNKGNQNYTKINVTGSNATSGSNKLAATLFSVDVDSGQTAGQTYLNETTLEWAGASLIRGAAQTEVMYTYVDIPGAQPSGTYTGDSNWAILFIE